MCLIMVCFCFHHRYVSYPRTESTQYPASYDLRETVREQASHPVWGAYARKLLADGLSVCATCSHWVLVDGIFWE